MATYGDPQVEGDCEPLPLRGASTLSPAEEFVNTITHGLGFVLSVVGAVVLVARALTHGDPWRLLGCAVFAGTLTAVYAASTLSHVFASRPLRRLFRMLDQGLIYLLIAGTYTPFALTFLRTPGWMLFLVLMWLVALGGFFSKVFFSHRVEAVAVWSYVLLGWMPVVSAHTLLDLVPAVALWWMLTGGLCYTVGTVFLMYDDKLPHFHGIWHLFVVAGSTCHFLAIFAFVAYPTGVLA